MLRSQQTLTLVRRPESARWFEGVEVRLWDHHEQRSVASAGWQVETTRIGFIVRVCSNEFQDPTFVIIAEQMADREALTQVLSPNFRMSPNR